MYACQVLDKWILFFIVNKYILEIIGLVKLYFYNKIIIYLNLWYNKWVSGMGNKKI